MSSTVLTMQVHTYEEDKEVENPAQSGQENIPNPPREIVHFQESVERRDEQSEPPHIPSVQQLRIPCFCTRLNYLQIVANLYHLDLEQYISNILQPQAQDVYFRS